MTTKTNGLRDWHLRPELPVLKCGPDAVQLGLDRRWAVRLSDLNSKEIHWLQASARKKSRLRRSAVNYGVSESRAIAICATLAKSGLLVPPAPNTPSAQIMLGATEKRAAGGDTDLPALSALRVDGQGQTTLDRRALSRVYLTNAGRLGAQVALLLAEAGVGHLRITDKAQVSTHDIGPYNVTEVGEPRLTALTERLTELGVAPDFGPDGEPDLMISIETGSQGAKYFGKYHQLVVPHLAVAVGEAEVEIGPFVMPDRSACTHCLQLTRAGADQDWAGLLAEIYNLPSRPVETVLGAAAASYIAAQALMYLDGTKPTLINALATMALPDLTPQITPVLPHPNCGCVALPPAV